MKRSKTCPKCPGTRLLHLTHVADQVGSDARTRIDADLEREPVYDRTIGAWRIARVPYQHPTIATAATDPSDMATAGVIEAYLCRGCGYTELYTLEPDSIPVDGKIVRRIEGGGESPYR